ncbi:MAG: TIGR01906 family membrane protein [Dehalococcoidales bacterium]|nr:TIGR01906 family membrane protein [Dehalococcoidales bacterium]
MLTKAIARIARILFVITLPFLFFSASIAWAVNSQWLYTSGFAKQNVGATTGLDKEQLAQVAKGFISYWNSGEERINIVVVRNGQYVPLFNEREIDHLVDVKTLFQFDYRMMFITGAYVLGYVIFSLYRRKRDNLRGLSKSIAWGSGLTLGLMLSLGAVALLGANAFESFWYQFHILSFANDLWELDPAKDYLLMLVPEGFWYDAVRDIVFATAGIAIVCGGAAIAHLIYHRDKKIGSYC